MGILIQLLKMGNGVKLYFLTILPLGIIFYFVLISKEEETPTELELERAIVPISNIVSVITGGLAGSLKTSSLSCDKFINLSSPRSECWCNPTKHNEVSKPKVLQQCSMCSEEATFLGPGQRVISYSFYKSKYLTRPDKDPRTNYYHGISRNLKAMKKVYPGWVMRVYSNLTFTPGDETCNLICSNQEDLYWCDVSKIKNPRNTSESAKHLHGMFWRFFPISDPLVSIFISRDIDSLLGLRERNAVKEWEERKDKAIHLMRDHPLGHRLRVMGGMWGMKNGLIKAEKREEMSVKLAELESSGKGGVDQYALGRVMYTEDYFPLTLAHDSFFCGVFNKTECIPFPDGGWSMEQPIAYVGGSHIFK